MLSWLMLERQTVWEIIWGKGAPVLREIRRPLKDLR